MAGGLAVILLAAGPLVFGSYLLNVLIQAFFFSIVAVTVDILWGYTGYLTFGQSAFFGLGAYAAGLVFTHGGFSAGYVVLALGAAITVTDPSCSVRVTLRGPCSQLSSRPSRSTVFPLVYADGERKTPTAPVVSSQRSIRSFGMSLHTR